MTLNDGLAYISGQVSGNPRYGILVYDLANHVNPELI